MARSDKLSTYRTTVATNNGTTRVTYHSTCVVQFDDERIILRTGGWKSVTTKRKMNQAARQFDLGFTVYQVDREWFLQMLPFGSCAPRAFDGDVFEIERAPVDRRRGAHLGTFAPQS